MISPMIFKQMPSVDMQISDLVPVAGEVIMDATSNRVKIGDGKSSLKDLPWVKLNIDLANEESSLSHTARMFIENNIDLIENNDYDTLYSHIATPGLAQEVTRALLKADLNPKPYLTNIPDSIRHILEPEDVWVEDTGRLYTKAELDSMMQYSQADMSVIDELNKKLFTQMGIPQNMIKVGN